MTHGIVVGGRLEGPPVRNAVELGVRLAGGVLAAGPGGRGGEPGAAVLAAVVLLLLVSVELVVVVVEGVAQRAERVSTRVGPVRPARGLAAVRLVTGYRRSDTPGQLCLRCATREASDGQRQAKW